MMRIVLAIIAPCLASVLAACEPGLEPRHVVSFLEARQDKVVMQKWDISCGAAALATILMYQHGYAVTERDVAAGMLRRTSAEVVRQRLGFSLLDLKRYAESQGFAADGFGSLTVEDLVKFGPTIVPILARGMPHFVVFRGLLGDRVLLADPAFGNRTMQVAKFENMWQRNVGFVIARQDDLPPPNLLAAKPSDFWASSVTDRSTVVMAQLATAPAAAGDAEKSPSDAEEGSKQEPTAKASDATEVAQDDSPLAIPGEAQQSAMTELAPAREAPVSPVGAAIAAARPANPAAPERPRTEPVTQAERSLPAQAEPATIAAGSGQPQKARALARVEKPAAAPVAKDAAPAETGTTAILLRRGLELLEMGDVSAARLFFERAAELGNVHAATLAGKTYDPEFFRETGVIGLRPDRERAIQWYRRAIDSADGEARRRLDELS